MGMEGAFTSLEALAPDDWEEGPRGDDGGSPPSELLLLGYGSRTDDTPASYHGNSTREEIEHYLKMRREMGCTAAATTTTTTTTAEPDDDSRDGNAGRGGRGGTGHGRVGDRRRRVGWGAMALRGGRR